MKPIYKMRLILKCMEIVEDTKLELDWWKVIRTNSSKPRYFTFPPDFNLDVEEYEIAFGVIDDKPVWLEDEYWNGNGDCCITSGQTSKTYSKEYWSHCTWLPPKPRTGMIEIPIEDIEYWTSYNERLLPPDSEYNIRSNNFYVACRKTLKEMGIKGVGETS